MRIDRGGAGERRVAAQAQARAEPLTSVEEAEAAADRRLAVAEDVPGDAEARRDEDALGRLQRTVGSVRCRPRGRARGRGSFPGTYSMPLQGQLPKAGLTVDGSKLAHLVVGHVGLREVA